MYSSVCLAYQETEAQCTLVRELLTISICSENGDSIGITFSYIQAKLLAEAMQSFLQQVEIEQFAPGDSFDLIGGMEIRFHTEEEVEREREKI